MLFLAEKLLSAAGFRHDELHDTWVAPRRLRPVVTVECDEHGAYILDTLVEVHAVLDTCGCGYNNFAFGDGYLSLVGLIPTHVAAVA
jgi:hypothetical protein